MINENDLQPGDIIGGFKIERVLGRGGMGVVFKAHELSLNRKIALKVLASRLSASDEFLQRFKREAQVIAALRHPNIVGVLSYGEDKGLHYFAMEYVQGKDLREIMQEKPLLPIDEALTIVRQVADGLGEAGSKGVVHRDIKPSNIMIDPMGRAFVTDFGVAHFAESDQKLTQTGLFLGTPEYASPEQATGLPLDVRSDIYSLGAVLYKMISGRPPVTGDSPLAVVVKISTEPVTPINQINPAVPKPVCDLIGKMMSKDLDARYQTTKALIEDLDACLQTLKGKTQTLPPAPPPPINAAPAPKAAHKPRRGLVRVLGGILGIALAVVLVVWLVEGGLFGTESPPETVNRPDAPVTEAADSETRHQPPDDEAAAETGRDSDAALLTGETSSGESPEGKSPSAEMAATAGVPDQDAAAAAAALPGDDAAASSTWSGAPAPVAETPERLSDMQAAVPAADAPMQATSVQDKGGDTFAAAAPARGSAPLAQSEPAVVAVAATPPSGSSYQPPPQTRSVAPQRPPTQRLPMLPKDPVVLVMVSGEESMTATARSHVYSGLRGSGLKILTFAEVPVLREKMRMGDMPISWYEIQQIAPAGQAQVLALAEIIQTGSMPINYMGRSDELIHATFTFQVMDMETGASIYTSSADAIKFTAMTRDQEIRKGVSTAISGAQPEIRRYWAEKTSAMR